MCNSGRIIPSFRARQRELIKHEKMRQRLDIEKDFLSVNENSHSPLHGGRVMIRESLQISPIYICLAL